jgi:hypothetical protein
MSQVFFFFLEKVQAGCSPTLLQVKTAAALDAAQVLRALPIAGSADLLYEAGQQANNLVSAQLSSEFQ